MLEHLGRTNEPFLVVCAVHVPRISVAILEDEMLRSEREREKKASDDKKTNPMKYLRIKKNTRPRKVTHRKKCYVFDLLNCILIFHLVLSAGTRIHDAFPNHVIVGSLLFEMSRV